VSVQGAGVVKTGDVGPQHRPIDTDATTDRSGWREAPKVDAWRAPGIEHVDRLLDQADAIDKAERIRQLAQTAAVQRAEAELIKQREAELNPNEALRGAAELREVLRSLVYGLKHPEFKPELETVVAQMNRIGRACLERLVIRSISVTRPEEIEECRQLLTELGAEGYLTEAEFEEIVDKHLAELAAKKAS
jgi:hypothetical protein